MNTQTITIVTRHESGQYIASIDGKDIAHSPLGSYKAATRAAHQVAGPEAKAKEIRPDVFRLIKPQH